MIPKLKRNIGRLNDAIIEAYENAQPGKRWHPKVIEGAGLVTYCNETVNYICKEMGYTGFDLHKTEDPDDAWLANQICDLIFMRKEWEEVSFEESQILANKGILLIAGWKHPENGHGHVVVIRPGEIGYSWNWECKVPKCLNVGRDVFIDKPISYAFGKNKKPLIFALKEML